MSRSPARAATARPVLVDPVNITKSAASTRAWPVVPDAGTRPGPAALTGHLLHEQRGQRRVLGGLRTTSVACGQGGMASPEVLINGLFHGPMTPTTPSGTRRVCMLRPSTNGESERIFRLGEVVPRMLGPVGEGVDAVDDLDDRVLFRLAVLRDDGVRDSSVGQQPPTPRAKNSGTAAGTCSAQPGCARRARATACATSADASVTWPTTLRWPDCPLLWACPPGRHLG